jgi:outer membrane protein assembly factor BamB
VIWKFQTEGRVHSTPAVVEGRTFVSGCDGFLRVVDVGAGKEVAHCEMGSHAAASPSVSGPRAFIGTFGEEVVCVNWQAATQDWQYQPKDRPFPFFGSAAVAGDRVVIGGRDKRVHCLKADTGDPLWLFETKGRVDSSPTIVGDRVFIGSADGNLYELDLKTGGKRWQFTAGAAVVSSPAVARGHLVIAADDGNVYCFGPSTAAQ